MSIPRFRGKVGQGDDKKWYFELSMWDLSGRTMIGGKPLGTFGPWETEEIAHKEMNNAAEICCKSVGADGTIDMKNGGEFKPFKSEMN